MVRRFLQGKSLASSNCQITAYLPVMYHGSIQDFITPAWLR